MSHNLLMVPRKINRSPTDLLKLLSNTVKHSNLFIDDPFLIPRNNNEKRSYALSKLSGIKSAEFVVKKFPFAFFLHNAFPQVSAFDPDVPELTEADLKDPQLERLIELAAFNRMDDIIKMYSCFDPSAIPIHYKILLIECSVMNNYERSPIENWFDMNNTVFWKYMDFAKMIFKQIEQGEYETEHQRDRAICAMINGYAQHNFPQHAIKLFDETKDVKCRYTIKNVIRCCGSIVTGLDKLKSILIQNCRMNADDELFSAIMCALSSLCRLYPNLRKDSLEFALNCYAEMERLNVAPSLGTLNYLLNVLKFNQYNQELDTIVSMIELNFSPPTKPDDSQFFINAMLMASKNGRSDIAMKLYQLINRATNIDHIFLNEKDQRKSIFHQIYLNFLNLALLGYPDQIEQLWVEIIPNICHPSDTLLNRFMDFLTKNQLMDTSVHKWPMRLFNTIVQFDKMHKDMSQITHLLTTLRFIKSSYSKEISNAFATLLLNDSEKLLSAQSQRQNETLMDTLIYLLAQSDQIDQINNLMQLLTNVEFEIETMESVLDLIVGKNLRKDELILNTIYMIMKQLSAHPEKYELAVNQILASIDLTTREKNILLSFRN